MSQTPDRLLVRGTFLDFAGPVQDMADLEGSFRHLPDGLLEIEGGLIKSLGPYSGDRLPADGADYVDLSGKLLVPGFIDTHVHFPQLEMIGAYGEQLLDWLNVYTFPTEGKYGDAGHASAMAGFFVGQLLKNGTTTALVFCSVHPESVDAFFEASARYDMRNIAGKVMMDRNAPDYLLDTPEKGYEQSKALIEKWHGRGRALYAITPRFAPTSSAAQLRMTRRLMEEHPDCHMQTHLSENISETAWVRELFPQSRDYLDVYDSFGLLGPRSVFAHSIHLCDREWETLAGTDSVPSFCPTSNLFLGSGLFDLARARGCGLRVGFASDIGAGTSLCQLRTLGEAYNVGQLRGYKLSALEGLYSATMGNARALSLDGVLGNFMPGKEADFVALDPAGTGLTGLRCQNSKSLSEQLFVLMTIGDDRAIFRTYVSGRLASSRN
jgi:guanine deaminase